MSKEYSKTELEKELASCLQKLREEKGISQEALGVQIGKGQSDIAKLENGSKRLTVIDLLLWMTALGVSYRQIDDIILPLFTKLNSKKSLWDKNEH